MSDTFYNLPGRVARMFFILAWPLIAIGTPSGVYLFRHPHQADGSFTTLEGFAVAGFIALPFAGACFLIALLTLPSAWRAKKIFAEFSAGNYLARWKYDDKYWSDYIAGEDRRLQKMSNLAFWCFFGLGIFIVIMMWVNAPESTRGKLIDASVIMASTISCGIAFFGIVRGYSSNRCRRLAKCGEAIVASHAAYMGGDLAFWGYGLHALQGARYISGDPAMIELVVGLNDAARTASTLVTTLGVLALQSNYSAGMSQTQLVPVPPGSEAVAKELVKKIGELNFPPPPVQTDAMHASPTTTIKPAPVVKPAKPPVTNEALQRRARRWWHMTFTLAILGVSLFFAAVVIDINVPAHHAPTVGDTLSVWGFFVFLLSFFTLPVALFKTLKVRRGRRVSARS